MPPAILQAPGQRKGAVSSCCWVWVPPSFVGRPAAAPPAASPARRRARARSAAARTARAASREPRAASGAAAAARRHALSRRGGARVRLHCGWLPLRPWRGAAPAPPAPRPAAHTRTHAQQAAGSTQQANSGPCTRRARQAQWGPAGAGAAGCPHRAKGSVGPHAAVQSTERAHTSKVANFPPLEPAAAPRGPRRQARAQSAHEVPPPPCGARERDAGRVEPLGRGPAYACAKTKLFS